MYVCIRLELRSTSITSSATWKRDHQRTYIYNVSETFLFIDVLISMAIRDLEQIFLENLSKKCFGKQLADLLLCLLDDSYKLYLIYVSLMSICMFTRYTQIIFRVSKDFVFEENDLYLFRFSLIYKAVERHQKRLGNKYLV